MCVRERERNLLGAVHAIRNREAKMGVTHDRKRLNTGGNEGRLCSLYAVLNAIADCLGASPVLC